METKSKIIVGVILVVILIAIFVAMKKGSASPVAGTDAPVAGSEAPSSSTDAPVAGTEAPVAGTEAPVAGSEAPAVGTDAPVAGTDAPVTGTEAPAAPSAPAVPAAPAAEVVDDSPEAVFMMNLKMPSVFQNSTEDPAVGKKKSASARVGPYPFEGRNGAGVEMNDREAITYMTSYMEVELLNTNDRASNLEVAKKHWKDVGSAGGYVKNTFYRSLVPNGPEVYVDTNVRPIKDVMSSADMSNTFLLTYYENMRDVLRVRLNTIFNWLRACIEYAGNVYNKLSMSADEANAVKENFRKAMVLLYGTSVDIGQISTLPEVVKTKKAPEVPEAIEINGIVANRVFINGQWYAFSINALAPYGYLDTRTSRMIFVCSSSNAAAAGCKSSDDVQCDFITSGLPVDINNSACDPNTIYGHYMILYVFTTSVISEQGRQLDPYKHQKRNKTAKKDRCYHNSADKNRVGCTFDGYGMCDSYTKPLTGGCRSGYSKKGTRCNAKYNDGACKGKYKITSTIDKWVERMSAPITISALVDDVTVDEYD
jgi:hypothetical protein